MRDRARTAGRAAALTAAIILLCQPAAYAHKMQLFAEVTGRTITGNAYMSGGGNPRDAQVVILGPGGKELGRTRTDDKGNFRFEASVRCDHTLALDSGDGHRAECTVRASELPRDLPAVGGTTSATSQPQRPGTALPGSSSHAEPPGAVTPTTAPSAASDPDAMRAMVARTVRNELEAYEQRTRIRDVIAGVGYVFGAWGIMIVFLRRRKGTADGAPRESRGVK